MGFSIQPQHPQVVTPPVASINRDANCQQIGRASGEFVRGTNDDRTPDYGVYREALTAWNEQI